MGFQRISVFQLKNNTIFKKIYRNQQEVHICEKYDTYQYPVYRQSINYRILYVSVFLLNTTLQIVSELTIKTVPHVLISIPKFLRWVRQPFHSERNNAIHYSDILLLNHYNKLSKLTLKGSKQLKAKSGTSSLGSIAFVLLFS